MHIHTPSCSIAGIGGVFNFGLVGGVCWGDDCRLDEMR
jgi:hypothetical protein